MPKHILKIIFLTIKITFIIAQSWAHVPYFEHQDFSKQKPFVVEYSIEQSLAIYAWLEKNDLGNSEDIDVFVFKIEGREHSENSPGLRGKLRLTAGKDRQRRETRITKK